MKAHANRTHRHNRARLNRFGRHYGRRRRRNPSLISGQGISKTVESVLWGAGGFFGTRIIPATFLSSYNTGLTGYAIEAATALGLGWGVKKFVNKEAGAAVLMGGGIAVAARVFEDYVGSKLPASMQTALQGLGDYGDSRYNLSGVFLDSYFAVPTISDPRGVTAPPALPATQTVPSVEAVKAAQTAMHGLGNRFESPYYN